MSSSSSTTTTTKDVADVKPKATPNSGGHTVKICTSAELKLELKKLWNGSDADDPHRKQLAKAAEKHEKWLDAIIGDVTDEMNEEVERKVLMETMAEMEDQSDGWWLLETCFNMFYNEADVLVEFTQRLRDEGLDFIEDNNDLALVFDYLKWYRDDMCGAVDSRKVLQAALEWIKAGKADNAMVQLYNNLTGYRNDHDFPDTELWEALNDPKGHPGVKLPVIETSNGLLWCDLPDALAMVVRYKGKRYDAGPLKLSKVPLDVLEAVTISETTNGFQFHEERREKPLKRSASAMDSNGASMPPALKRSKSVVPPLKRSASMDSNGVEEKVDLMNNPMVYDRPIRFCGDCVKKDHPAGAYDKRGSHTCHLCPKDAEFYDFDYVMNDYNRGGTTLFHGYKCRERCGNTCVVKEFDKERYMYNPSPGWVYSNVYSNGFRCFKCRGKEDSLGPEQEDFD